VLAVSFAANMPAALVLGAFNFNGSVTVTQNTITWKSDVNLADQATMGSTNLTGSFAGLGGSTITILDLDRATDPVGVVFPAQPYVSFNPALGFPTLNVNFIAPGAFPSTNCTSPPATGQVCTLSSAQVSGGSPSNTSSTGSTTPDSSSATWTVRGVSSDGLEVWSGIFTSQFNQPYQDVIAGFFGPGGAVSNAYSGSIVVSSAVPEPDTAILLGFGLLVVSLGVRRLTKAN
jgi:hypothetical protein